MECDHNWQEGVAGRLRAIALVEAAERAALTPISVERLHALAYLSDVLSPVWGLTPFDPVALKTDRQPFFGRFQDHLDDLVVVGLLEVSSFSYVSTASQKSGKSEVALSANYHFRYDSPELGSLVRFIAQDEELGPRLEFFVAMANAMGRLPDSEIARAVTKDASWDDADVPPFELVTFSTLSGAAAGTRTDNAIAVFDELAPGGEQLSAGARLRLYAAFLAERLKAA